jgi:aspartyl-tRNA synthetase
MVLNGNEVGGGSDQDLSKRTPGENVCALGMSKEKRYTNLDFCWAPLNTERHRMVVSHLGSTGYARSRRQRKHSRLYAFPKNNAGRDVMLDAPSTIDEKQLTELQIRLTS